MTHLGTLFSSSARTEILRVLHHQTRPVSLRFLADMAGVHPHSAERVIASMHKEGLISRHRKGNRLQIMKRPVHADWTVLTEAFNAADRVYASRKLPDLNRRAKIILPFIAEASLMIKRAKRSRRAT